LGGPLWACGGVGLGFGVYAVLGILVASRLENISPVPLLRGLRGPLLACLPMVAGVLGVRFLLRAGGVHIPLVYLGAELLTGAVIYVASALWLAPAVARELFMVLRSTLLDRRPRPTLTTAPIDPQPNVASS
jgi:lipopolysaccharide exporter